MKTLLLKIDPQNPEPSVIQKTACILQEGGLVAFPTETVYGLGADALNGNAVLSLFEAKQRPLDNPPIVHIAEVKDVYPLVLEVTKKAELLMEKFWPGALTLVFKRSGKVPDVTAAGLDTIAVRMPRHPVALALIRATRRPIAAPSANLAGKPSPTTAQHVYDDLNGRINAILDGGSTNIGVESTVVDLSVDPPMLLRPGGVSFEVLKQVLPDIVLHSIVKAEEELSVEKIRSPGMKHKHYAPKAQVIVVEGNLQSVIVKVKELAESYEAKGVKVGVLATDQTQGNYQVDIVKSLGDRYNIAGIAKNLFFSLREMDALNLDFIIAEGFPLEGLGLAVMNRLRKASGYRIVKAN